MIENFKQSWLEEFWNTGFHRRAPADLHTRLINKLDILNSAKELADLAAPPSNHLHQLHGDRQGEWAIAVNGPWRLCFRFENGHVFDVELTQYH
jgi:toxin HigB-1